MRRAHKFWDLVVRQGAGALRIDGPIAADEDAFFGDEATPAMLREALADVTGDLEVYINSPGGDVVAATQIYTMLKEHKGRVTVKIDGLAASAASVVAMAGDRVLMAPSAYMMIHCASSLAVGNKHEMAHEAEVLEEVDRGIRTAYSQRTGMSDQKLRRMMDEETWLSAAMAIEMGFADGYIGEDPEEEEEEKEEEAVSVEEPEEEETEEEEEKEEQGRAAASMEEPFRLPAVAYSAKDARERMLERALKRASRKDGAEEARKEAAAEDEAVVIQRLKLRLLSY